MRHFTPPARRATLYAGTYYATPCRHAISPLFAAIDFDAISILSLTPLSFHFLSCR
jgi:hypothetical protein